MQSLGYGETYQYAHDFDEGVCAGVSVIFPKRVGEHVFYEPTERGLEAKIREKLVVPAQTQCCQRFSAL